MILASSTLAKRPLRHRPRANTNPPEITVLLTPRTAAVQHMETYWSILEKVRGSSLRLTKIDDEIYEHLKKDFPEFDPAETINEDEMKSKTGKERWRKFLMEYEKKVDDYNFGTMLRSSPKTEYDQHGTIFGQLASSTRGTPNMATANNEAVPRMQFYAVEIARYVWIGGSLDEVAAADHGGLEIEMV